MSNIDHTLYDIKAKGMWDAMSNKERTGIRFGMFPSDAMKVAIEEGYDGQQLSVSLMKVAKNNGGMVS